MSRDTVVYTHNDRGYFNIYNKFIEKYPKYPTWFFKEIGALGEFQADLQNNIALDILYPESRESAYAFASRCSYDPVEASGSTCSVLITLTEIMDKTLPVGYQIGGISSITGDLVYFETLESASSRIVTTGDTHTNDVVDDIPEEDVALMAIGDEVSGTGIPASTTISDILSTTSIELSQAATGTGNDITLTVDTNRITVDVEQKRTYTDVNIGTIDSQVDYYEMFIDGYFKIVKTSVSLIINSLGWERQNDLDFSESTDRHFILTYQSSGKSIVSFGNGTYGEKPPLNEVVYATFSVTDGLSGVMNADEININVGEDIDIESVTNALATSGGNDAESVESIVRNSRIARRSKDIAWTIEDLVFHARASSSSVIKALAIPAVNEATIHVVPAGGGVPSGALLTTMEDYVQSKTQFGLMPIYGLSPSYIITGITADITVSADFVEAKVQDYVEFGLTIIAASFDNQVTEYYDDNGIDLCRQNVINSIWSWAFVEDDNEALAFILDKWKELLVNRDYREFGQDLEVGDLWIMGNALYAYGVDIFSLTSPTSNVSIGSEEISETGTVTVTPV